MADDHRTPIAFGIATLGKVVGQFDRLVSEHIGEVTWQEAALTLRHVQRQIDDLKATAGAIEARIITARADEGITEPVEVPGVGLVDVRRSKNRRAWDSEALASAVVDSHLMARADGELPTPWEVRDWIMEAAGIGYWRVTALRSLGLRPGDYCDESPGIRTVQITGGPDTPGQGL